MSVLQKKKNLCGKGAIYTCLYILKTLRKNGCLKCGAEWRSGKAKDFGPKCLRFETH